MHSCCRLLVALRLKGWIWIHGQTGGKLVGVPCTTKGVRTPPSQLRLNAGGGGSGGDATATKALFSESQCKFRMQMTDEFYFEALPAEVHASSFLLLLPLFLKINW